MNVYFTGQLYRKDEYLKEYEKIVKTLKRLGHEVIQDTMDSDAEYVLSQTEEQFADYYKCWLSYVKKMDVCVADISFPSTINIGFEIASLIGRGIPVVALYRKGEDPIFVSPEFADRMIKLEYTLDSLEGVLEWGLDEAEKWLQRRFTMLISGDVDTKLSHDADKLGLSRSEYIRRLIMEKGL